MAKKPLVVEQGVVLDKQASVRPYNERDEGLLYNNGNTEVRVQIEGQDREVVTEDQTQILTNKTVDADLNTISNLEVDNLKAGVLDTDLTSVSATDDTIPSAKAVKDYADAVATQANTDLNTHINKPFNAHDAQAINVIPSGNLTGTNAQSALVELQLDIDTRAKDSQVVHLTGTETITGLKTIESPVLNSPEINSPTRLDVKKDLYANLVSYATTATNGQLCFASDEKKMYQVIDGLLKAVGGGISFIGKLERPTGLVNSSNQVFVLSSVPVDGTLVFTLNGLVLDHTKFSLAGTAVTLVNAPVFGQVPEVSYLTSTEAPSAGGSAASFQVEYVTIDAQHLTDGYLTLTLTPINPSKVLLDIPAGTTQNYGIDYIVVSNQVQWAGFGLAGDINIGDVLRIQYFA